MSETTEKIPYWEQEKPDILSDKKLKVIFYKKAGALQLMMRGKNDHENNYLKKSVNLRKHILQKNPELLKTLAEIFTNWHEELLQKQKDDENV